MRPPVVEVDSVPSRPEAVPGSPATQRLLSLDVFRGATIAAMILVNNPGSDAIYPPLRHATWHGWTPTDMIFPFFLWIVGVAITLSLPKRLARGHSKGELIRHAAVRSAIIFAVGLLMAGFPYYNLSTIRIPGVLQRIAICSFLASVIFLYTNVRGRIIWTLSLLAAYWGLMMFVPVPGLGAGFLERDANFARYIDGLFLSGHMYSATKTWDPEGIVSTLPAIATALLGVLMGDLLRSRLSRVEQTVWALLGGNALIVAALMMNPWMPINKSIWTTSFAVFMAGMAMVGFAAIYWLIDVKGYRRFTGPFAIYGMNAIAVYILSGLVARLLNLLKTGGGASWKTALFQSVFAPLAAPMNASLLYAIANVLLLYSVAWLLYRRRWFIRF